MHKVFKSSALHRCVALLVLFCKTLTVARNYFSAEAFNARQENSSTEGTVSLKVRSRRFLRDLHEFIYVQETLAHMLHAFYLHSQKAARWHSPEFWSIHCNESMCAFKILQICWSWAEREGASHLLHYIETKSSKRQPACPCLWNMMQSNFSYVQLH